MLASARLPTQTMPTHSSSVTRALLVLLVVLVVGAPSLVYPFGRDQGEYATVAKLTLEGRVSYRDVFNVKPPGTYLLHAFALTVFGHSMQAIRWLDLLWQAATALLLLGIADRLGLGRRAALLAPVLYSVAYYSNNFWNTAQTDGFLNLPTALAVLAYLHAQDKGEQWAYAASGAAIAVAVLFKYPIGILLPLLWVCAVLSHRYPWRAVVWMSVGCTLLLAACAIWLHLQGALVPFVESQYRYVTAYRSRDILGYSQLVILAAILMVQWAMTLLIVVGAVAAVTVWHAHRFEPTARAVLVAAAWYVAGVLSYIAQGKGYVYHSLPMLAPYALLGAATADLPVGRTIAGRSRRLWLVGLTTVILAFPATLYLGRMERSQAPLMLGRIALGQFKPQQICKVSAALCEAGEPGFRFTDDLAAAEHIAARTMDTEPVFIWGFEPPIYFLAQREPASRFIYNFVLFGDWDWPELRIQLLADLEHSPPRYIVVASDDALPMVTGTDLDSRAALQTFPELRHLIETDYTREVTFGYLTLYRRLGP
ncbi:MAG: glycosyltransferase family 39 protein [Anaerolineales bacterium]